MDAAPSTPGSNRLPTDVRDADGVQSPTKTTRTETEPSNADLMALMNAQFDRTENTKEMFLHRQQRAEASDSKINAIESKLKDLETRKTTDDDARVRLENDLTAQVKRTRISFDTLKKDADSKAKQLTELNRKVQEVSIINAGAPTPGVALTATRAEEMSTTAIIGGFGRYLPEQVFLHRFNQFVRPRILPDILQCGEVDSPFLVGSSIQFRATSVSAARSLVSSERTASISLKDNDLDMRIYATMQKTREQKDRTQQLMKMGEKVQSYYNGAHCETNMTVCWRSAGIVVGGKRICTVGRDSVLHRLARRPVQRRRDTIRRNIVDLVKVDVGGGGRSA